jgi:hypothetical protein
VQNVQKVLTFYSQIFLAALTWDVVPAAISSGPRPGAAGFAHGWVGAITAYAVTETMTPRCPEAPPPKWVSIARSLA